MFRILVLHTCSLYKIFTGCQSTQPKMIHILPNSTFPPNPSFNPFFPQYSPTFGVPPLPGYQGPAVGSSYGGQHQQGTGPCQPGHREHNQCGASCPHSVRSCHSACNNCTTCSDHAVNKMQNAKTGFGRPFRKRVYPAYNQRPRSKFHFSPKFTHRFRFSKSRVHSHAPNFAPTPPHCGSTKENRMDFSTSNPSASEGKNSGIGNTIEQDRQIAVQSPSSQFRGLTIDHHGDPCGGGSGGGSPPRTNPAF